eukprot:SAG25_NODE_3475_length_1068_cov_1.654283_1_plen_235_part_00
MAPSRSSRAASHSVSGKDADDRSAGVASCCLEPGHARQATCWPPGQLRAGALGRGWRCRRWRECAAQWAAASPLTEASERRAGRPAIVYRTNGGLGRQAPRSPKSSKAIGCKKEARASAAKTRLRLYHVDVPLGCWKKGCGLTYLAAACLGTNRCNVWHSGGRNHTWETIYHRHPAKNFQQISWLCSRIISKAYHPILCRTGALVSRRGRRCRWPPGASPTAVKRNGKAFVHRL